MKRTRLKRSGRSKGLIRTAPLSFAGGLLGSAFFVGLSILAIAISTYAPQTVSTLRSAVSDAAAPVLHTVSKPMQEAAVFVRSVTGLADLQAENASLREENERLREWYQTAMSLDAENKSLRELMNVKVESHSRYITARVLADSGYTFVKSILVHAGRDDGVKKGQAVISSDGVAGRITEAGDKVSRVLLLTDINSRIPVLLEKNQQHAILAGQNDGTPVIAHLPPDVEVEEGQRVVTSGKGGVFPYGLPIGKVRVDEGGQAVVELFADFNRMVHVRIIDRPDDPNLKRALSAVN